ncbi:hypothetical protein AOLI_G00198780, partial [Acnodon oligacanthus]
LTAAGSEGEEQWAWLVQSGRIFSNFSPVEQSVRSRAAGLSEVGGKVVEEGERERERERELGCGAVCALSPVSVCVFPERGVCVAV